MPTRAVAPVLALGFLTICRSILAQAPALPALHGEALAFDAAGRRLVVFGGSAPQGWFSGTWQWDGRRWRVIADSAASPPLRAGHAMGYDPETWRVMIFGGMFGPPPRLRCDTWTLRGAAWSKAADSTCVTDRVRNASLVYDPHAHRMLLLDGPAVANDTMRPMRLFQWTGGSWTLLDSTGPRRTGFSAATWDESRSVLVVPVVYDGPDVGVWEWNGRAWNQQRVSGPSHRQTYGLAYDSRRRRVVLVGGQGGQRGPYYDDMWTWDGARWEEIPRGSGETPPGRGGGTLLNDSVNGRLLYFGGYNENTIADLWSFDRQGWRKLSP